MTIHQKIYLLFSIIWLVFWPSELFAQDTLLFAGSQWRYQDNGQFPGEDWINANFNDSSWSIGAAPLGYGMSAISTNISYGSNPNQKHITSWFRSSFRVSPPNPYSSAKFRIRRDDGIVVYLNGRELIRNNMPTGVITPQTLALDIISGQAQLDYFDVEIPADSLRPGLNHLAVEIHQAGPTSSDLAFDLELCTSYYSSTVIPKGSIWKYAVTPTPLPSSWSYLLFNDSSWPSDTAILGYGNDNENTTIGFGPDPQQKYITTYFRKSFQVVPNQKMPVYSGSVLVDDGCVVYVNGIEVFRRIMPPGPITYQTPAMYSVDKDDELFYWPFSFDSSHVVNGTNVIAVEVHQSHGGSSDLSFDLELQGRKAFGGKISRGPYWQSVGETSATVRWRTDVATPTSFWWGPNPQTMTDSIFFHGTQFEHEIKLTGLQPGTKYYYRLGDGRIQFRKWGTNRFFKTNPPKGTKNPFRVWAIADQGSLDIHQKRVRDAFWKYNGGFNTDLMLTMGDNAYDGQDMVFQRAMFDMYAPTLENTPLWAGFGNHEGYGGANSRLQVGPFYQIFTLPKNGECGGVPSGTEAYYSYDYANVHFIHLNSYDIPKDSTGPMAQWLKADLANHQQPWVVAIWHHPPYSFSHHNSDLDTFMTRMRTQINPIIERAGVDLVLNGHSHVYERSFPIQGHYGFSETFLPEMKRFDHLGHYPNDCGYRMKGSKKGTIYLTAGTGGMLGYGQLGYPSTAVDFIQAGSMVLDFNDNRLEVKMVNEFLVVKDSFTVFKSVNNRNAISICQGKQVELKASWPGKYVWNDSLQKQSRVFQAQTPGTFHFSVSDGFGCLADTFQIQVLEVPVLFLGNDTLLAQGQTMVLTSSIPGQYLWNTGQTGQQIIAQPGGVYWLQITLPNGCLVADTIKIDFDILTVDEKKPGTPFQVYPNPSYGEFFVKSGDKISEIRLLDVYGREVSSDIKYLTPKFLQVSLLGKGFYFLQVTYEGGKREVQKLRMEQTP